MSLDVYIKNKKKEDREWVANITHNMNKMAQRIFVSENKETLYDYVWRPEELGREIDTDEMKIEYKEACEDHPGYIIEASR